MIDLGRKVQVLYKAMLEDGTVIDSTYSHKNQSLEFLVGRQQVIPGFNQAVHEMSLGEKRTVFIPADMAYGYYQEELVEMIPCDAFPNWEKLPVGGYIMLQAPQGAFRVRVLKVEDNNIFFDKNHELAGRNLVLELEVIGIHGENGSLIDSEHAAGCSCGCSILREQLDSRHSDDCECCEH